MATASIRLMMRFFVLCMIKPPKNIPYCFVIYFVEASMLRFLVVGIISDLL